MQAPRNTTVDRRALGQPRRASRMGRIAILCRCPWREGTTPGNMRGWCVPGQRRAYAVAWGSLRAATAVKASGNRRASVKRSLLITTLRQMPPMTRPSRSFCPTEAESARYRLRDGRQVGSMARS